MAINLFYLYLCDAKNEILSSYILKLFFDLVKLMFFPVNLTAYLKKGFL